MTFIFTILFIPVFLFILVDVSIPVDLDLVLFERLVLEETGPEFFLLLVQINNNGLWGTS